MVKNLFRRSNVALAPPRRQLTTHAAGLPLKTSRADHERVATPHRLDEIGDAVIPEHAMPELRALAARNAILHGFGPDVKFLGPDAAAGEPLDDLAEGQMDTSVGMRASVEQQNFHVSAS